MEGLEGGSEDEAASALTNEEMGADSTARGGLDGDGSSFGAGCFSSLSSASNSLIR